jgi:hypothetical protein
LTLELPVFDLVFHLDQLETFSFDVLVNPLKMTLSVDLIISYIAQKWVTVGLNSGFCWVASLLPSKEN